MQTISQQHDNPLKKFYDDCLELASEITDKRSEIELLLSSYQTLETTRHEFESTIDVLRGVADEFRPIDNPLSGLSISVFIPLNLPLYSLILYGVIPSAFCDNLYIRPPEVLKQILNPLAELLNIQERFPAISFKNVPRHIFVDLYAKDSDVVLFTGKYENALAIHDACPSALLLYEGSGVCPFVIAENADLDLAVEKLVAMRCFNSGQDCVAPDAVMVPSSLADSFKSKLMSKLDEIVVGDSTDPTVRVSRIVKSSYIDQIEAWLEREKDNLIYGGQIDIKNSYVYPTVISKNINEHTGSFHEFFAPVFYLLEYKNEHEVVDLFQTVDFKEHSMYSCVFGSSPEIEAHLQLTTQLRNETVNDTEAGNKPYGGYGAKANFVLYGDTKTAKPILISRDIHLALS